MAVDSGVVLISVGPSSCLRPQFIHSLTLLESLLSTFEGVADSSLSLCSQILTSVCLHSLLSTLLVKAMSAHDFKLALGAYFGLAGARESTSSEHEVYRIMHRRSQGHVLHGFPIASRGSRGSQELILVESTMGVVRLLTFTGLHS